jgi:hypothetical protein
MDHPNNVIEHEGWTVVRNENLISDIEANPAVSGPYRFYKTYHNHEHPRNSGFYNMFRVYLHQLEHVHVDPAYYLCDCGAQVPATVLGALVLIRESDDNAIIR